MRRWLSAFTSAALLLGLLEFWTYKALQPSKIRTGSQAIAPRGIPRSWCQACAARRSGDAACGITSASSYKALRVGCGAGEDRARLHRVAQAANVIVQMIEQIQGFLDAKVGAIIASPD